MVAGMRTITKFVAEDGSEFSDVNRCEDYDKLCLRVDAVMAAWPEHPKDDSCSFANGGGFFPIDPELYASTRNQLLGLAAENCSNKWIAQARESQWVDLSWPMRILDEDSFQLPVSKALRRLYCVDKSFREWGQPFYAMNPDKGQQIDLSLVQQ